MSDRKELAARFLLADALDEIAKMTHPPGTKSIIVRSAAALRQEPSVEEVARVIDPWAFSVVGNIMHTERAGADREAALAKADSILKLIEAARRSDDVGDGWIKAPEGGWAENPAGSARVILKYAFGGESADNGVIASEVVPTWWPRVAAYRLARHPVTPAGEG